MANQEKQYQMTIGGIQAHIVRKRIKNLRLSVSPPLGRVRVAAPFHVNEETIRAFIASRLNWIKRHQERFETQARQSVREFVTGESHYYQGQRYLLNVIPHTATPGVSIRDNTVIELRVRPDSSAAERERVLLTWYRRRLREQIPALIAKWEIIIGVKVAEWGIKRMKTRWGTCNITARRIWFNLELIKKPPICLEYIVVHEMVHLLERLHNARFFAFMSQFMPLWKQYRDELNRTLSEHEAWERSED